MTAGSPSYEVGKSNPAIDRQEPSKQLDGSISAKPIIAVVCNSLPPYRLSVHLRIAREMPDVRLRTLITHEDDRWPLDAPPEVGVVSFSNGDSCWNQSQLRYAWREWRKTGRIIRWARDEGVSAMVLLGYSDAGRVRLIAWCRRRGIPCFVWGDSNIRDESVSGLKAVVKKLLVSRVLGWATGALTCGRLGREYFAKYGVPPEHTFSFPVEPDYEQIRSLPIEKVEEARQKFNLDPARRRIIFSGRLVPLKRVDLLLEAFANLAASRPEWDLYIVGDGESRSHLEQRVRPGLQDRVIWTGHVIEPAILFGIYRASDVLVMPSDQERWSLVIIEAVASGMAVVSSDIPGAAAELVRDRENGRIFPAGNLAELTQCLRDVTAAERTDAMKHRSPAILADWQRTGDPIRGLRQALRFAKVVR